MQVLVIGGGGREHTLVWKLAQSKKVTKLYAAPGNPGMKDLAECVDLDMTDLSGLADWAEKHAIDLTVVGPEAPLVAGIVDVFKARGLTIFGPSAKAAEIEGSKIFSKELMQKYGVPTAFFKVCDNLADARAFVEEKGAPIVIKADGLAAGKGVVVAMPPAIGWSSRNSWMGKKLPCWLSLTAKPSSPCWLPRITNGWTMGIRGPIPVVWVLTARLRS